MNLYDIIANLKFIGIKNYRELDIDALSCDTNDKLKNSMFFCLKGTKVDGHKFAVDAVKNGAICLVVEKYLDLPVTQILVENSRAAMSYISSAFFGTNKSNIKFVGITGTNGKTTTSFLIREILMQMGKRVGLIGTEGVYINSLLLPASLTTPDPINLHKLISDMQQNDCEYCVMEVSAHAIALNKIDGINYDVVALSNITKDHLDFFLTMDNYVKTKASLFDVKHTRVGVVNFDAKYCKEIAKKSSVDVLSFGKDANLKIVNIVPTINGSKFKIEYNNKVYSVCSNLIGEYNVYNITMAMGCLIQLGFELKDIVKVINETKFTIPGRFNKLQTPSNFNVIVDYAHTPDGIFNILTAIKTLKTNRVITVFGCGGNRDKTKRSEMGAVAASLSDFVIVTSDNPRDENPELIIEDILNGVDYKNVVKITDRKAAIEYALSIAKENDIVAILGKGAEMYQEVCGVKLHFSDYEVVDDYFKYTIKEAIKL